MTPWRNGSLLLLRGATGLEGLLTGRLEGTGSGPHFRIKLGAGHGLDPHFGAPGWRIVFGVELFGQRPGRTDSSENEVADRGYHPYIQFPWSRSIADDWSVNGMVTVTWSTVARAILEPTLVIEHEFGRGDLFAEYIGDYTGQARQSGP